jgi:hypothetical protein
MSRRIALAMTGLFDERARRALLLLEEAGERPLSFAELRAAGVENPAQVVYELELAGHPVERSAAGVRLARPPEERSGAAGRRRRRG